MEKPLFTLKPSLFHALAPTFLHAVFKFGIGAIITFYTFFLLNKIEVVIISSAKLLGALIIIVCILAFASIKFKMIKLHRTRYIFYKTHVVRERKIITAKRRSVPYKHIQRIINDSSLWDTLVNAGDISLQTSLDNRDSLVLHSVKNSQDIEHKIHKLIGDEDQYE